MQAADSILQTVLKPERAEQLRQEYPNPENIAWVPMSILLDGENVIPYVFAKRLKQNIGGEVVPAVEIIKGRPLPHRHIKEAAKRLAKEARAKFGVDPAAIPLLEGKKVILVDDQFKTGGTARDAAVALAQAGIEVSGVRTLGASAWGDISIAPGEIVAELAGRFGQEGVSVIEEVTGMPLLNLTKTEARAINTIAKKTKSLERFKNELRKQSEAYVRRGEDFQRELKEREGYRRESHERVPPPEPAEKEPPLIQAKPDAPGTVSVGGEDVNIIPKAATPEEKAQQVGLTKDEVSALAKTAKEEDHFFQNITDPLGEEAGQLVVPDYGKLRDIYNRSHDWIFTFGEAKRLDEPLYHQLMASYGKRNAGVEKAVDGVRKAITGQEISSKDDALLSFVYEDKRLTPPEELKELYDKLSNILKTAASHPGFPEVKTLFNLNLHLL